MNRKQQSLGAILAAIVFLVIPIAAIAQSYIGSKGTTYGAWTVGTGDGGTSVGGVGDASVILVNNNGNLDVKDNLGANYRNARVATPIGNQDAVNKAYADTHAAGISTATANGCLSCNGSGSCSFTTCGGGSASPSGTGLAYVADGGFADAAVVLNGDLAQGSLVDGGLNVEVVGLENNPLPSVLDAGADYLQWTGLKWAFASPVSPDGGSGAQSISGDSTGAISGTNIPVTNTKMQGVAWSATTPTSAQIPVLNSSIWTPTSVSGNGTLSASGVLGITNFTLPSQASGGVAWDNGGTWTGSAAGTSGQCLQSGGTGAPTWGSCGSGGSGSLTTDVTTGTISGATAATVVAMHGTGSPAEVTVYAAGLAWNNGYTYLGDYPSAPGFSLLNLGGTNAAQADGTNLTLGKGMSTSTKIAAGDATSVYVSNLGNVQIPYSGEATDFAGGQHVVGIGVAATEPTSIPSGVAGDTVLYGWSASGTWLGLDANGIRPTGPAIGSGGQFLIEPSSVTGTGVSVGLQAGAGSGSDGSGFVESQNGTSLVFVNDTSVVLETNGSLTLDATSSMTAVPICLGCNLTNGPIDIGSGVSALLRLESGTAIHLDAASTSNVPIAIGAANTIGPITMGNTGSSGIAIVSGGTGVSINTSGSGATTAIGSTSAGSTTIESTHSSFSVSGASLTGEATGGFTLDSPGSANSPFCFGCTFSTGSIALGNANTSSYTSTTGGLNLLQGATVEATNAAGSTPYFTYTSSQGTSNVPLQSTPSSGSLVEHSAAPQGTVNSQAQLVNSLLWGFGETVSSATPKTLYTYTIPTGKGAYGIASVSCRATTAAGIVGVGDSWGASYNFQCQNPSGSANCNSALIGTAQSASSMSGTMASVAASGATYVVSVTNLATVTVDCTAAITNGIVN